MPTEQECAYAAGIFDGEGTIDLKDSVRMAVKMTDREPVDAMRDILGGHFYQWQDTKTGRPVYEWRAAGWTGVIESIEYIFPYSRGKRKQLDVVANFYSYKERFGLLQGAKEAASFQLRGLRVPAPLPITFDVETMGFEADTLPLLTCAMLEGGNETGVWTPYKMTPASDKDLAVTIRETLEAAPYTIGWCSDRFDINYINTRLAFHGERPMFLGCHIDAQLLFDITFGNKKRTSLENAARQLGVTDEDAHKTPIDWVKWNAANAGDEDGMQYVIEHGANDVILTKRVYDALV
jgi:uncharacterized protein YprB with RNaseH-like and TPR domain